MPDGRRPSDAACGGLARRRPHRLIREAHHRCRDAADDGGLFRAARGRRRQRWRFDAIREVGPAGHYFGAAHTLARYETAFYTPLLSNWDNYETWLERGADHGTQRANHIWKQLVAEYEQPPIDPAIDEALKDYMERRKREGGSPVN